MGVVHLAAVGEVGVAVQVFLVPRPVPRLGERPLLVPPQRRDARPVPVPLLGPRQAAPAVDRVRRVEDPGVVRTVLNVPSNSGTGRGVRGAVPGATRRRSQALIPTGGVSRKHGGVNATRVRPPRVMIRKTL